MIETNHIAIEKADVQIERFDKDGKNPRVFEVENLSLYINNTDIREETISDDSKVMFSESITTSFDAFEFSDSQSEATFSIGAFDGDIDDKKQVFSDILFHVPDKVDFSIHSLDINKMNWKKLWDREEIDLASIKVNYPSASLVTKKKTK